MRRRMGLFLSLAAATLSGCGSILYPGPDKVEFKSDPPGATINLDGKDVGQTPATIKVDRSAFLVKMRLPGYKEGTAPILYKPNGWMWCDLVFLPILFGDGTVIAMDIDMAARGDRVAVGEVSIKLENAN